VRLSRLQGLHPRGNRRSQRNSINASLSRHPLLGFPPPHGLTPTGERGRHLATVTLRLPPVRRQTERHLRSTALPLAGAAYLSRDKPPISRFPAFDRLLSFPPRGQPDAGIFGCCRLTSDLRTSHEVVKSSSHQGSLSRTEPSLTP